MARELEAIKIELGYARTEIESLRQQLAECQKDVEKYSPCAVENALLRGRLAECERALEVADDGRNYANELLSAVAAEKKLLTDFAKECILGAYRPSELPLAAREALAKVGAGGTESGLIAEQLQAFDGGTCLDMSFMPTHNAKEQK